MNYIVGDILFRYVNRYFADLIEDNLADHLPLPIEVLAPDVIVAPQLFYLGNPDVYMAKRSRTPYTFDLVQHKVFKREVLETINGLHYNYLKLLIMPNWQITFIDPIEEIDSRVVRQIKQQLRQQLGRECKCVVAPCRVIPISSQALIIDVLSVGIDEDDSRSFDEIYFWLDSRSELKSGIPAPVAEMTE